MKKGIGRMKHALNKNMPIRHKDLRWTMCGYRVAVNSVTEDVSKATCQCCRDRMEKKN